MGWQDAVVALIVAGALGYLVSRFVRGAPRKSAPRRPDVAVGALVRRGRPRTGGSQPDRSAEADPSAAGGTGG